MFTRLRHVYTVTKTRLNATRLTQCQTPFKRRVDVRPSVRSLICLFVILLGNEPRYCIEI